MLILHCSCHNPTVINLRAATFKTIPGVLSPNPPTHRKEGGFRMPTISRKPWSHRNLPPCPLLQQRNLVWNPGVTRSPWCCACHVFRIPTSPNCLYFCSQAYSLVMGMLWKRLNDSGKNWRHVYKVLLWSSKNCLLYSYILHYMWVYYW